MCVCEAQVTKATHVQKETTRAKEQVQLLSDALAEREDECRVLRQQVQTFALIHTHSLSLVCLCVCVSQLAPLPDSADAN